ncbi:unnamed protein product [Nippostrongylus brasiliensis]|uniref:Uncharacterized protein n=1 Tax=Nippostrongylus brasiliensis TaxID=27835 RepID=A0A3P6ZQJ9_NIPBR|nr:unnamed protein product [Nippostrongylus brasiliensis]
MLYALYRLVRAIVFLESDLFSLVRKIIEQNKVGNVEFFNIITRFRLNTADVAQDHDFLVFNDGFGLFDDLFESCWLIYTVTDKYVYFVRVLEPSLSMAAVQRQGEICYKSADRVARMDISEFVAEAKTRLSSSKGRVVMVHSTPCCSGSMLGRLLSTVDRTEKRLVVHGEPPVLNSLAVLAHLMPIEIMRALTFASLRFSMRHLEKDQVLVMKTRSCCAKLVPYVHATMPSIQHLYLTSKDLTAAIPRLIDATSRELPTFEMVCCLMTYSSTLCDFFTNWRLLEPEMVQKIGPKSPCEFALAQIMGCVINYQRNLKYYALETIYAEDLMSDPLTAVRPILDVCGLGHVALTDTREWKEREVTAIRSQTTSLDDQQRARVKLLVEYLQQDWCR